MQASPDSGSSARSAQSSSAAGESGDTPEFWYILFLGGWASPIGVLDGVWWFFLKMYFLIFAVVWIRWTFPRTQFYGLLNLSWKILIPVSLVTLLLTAGVMKIPHLF